MYKPKKWDSWTDIEKKNYIAKHKAYQKAYKQTTKYKAYQKAYHKPYSLTPERKAYEKARRHTPEHKAYHKAYLKKTKEQISADQFFQITAAIEEITKTTKEKQ